MIRRFQPEDAPAAAAILDDLEEGFETAASLLHRVESMPARAEPQFLVAVEDDRVVGHAEAKRRWSSDPDVGQFRVVVDRQARRRGIGAALWEGSVGHLLELGVKKLTTWDDAGRESAAFATARGFRPQRRTIHSVLVPEPVEVRERPDARLLSLGEALDRAHEVFGVYQATEADVPSDEYYGNMSFEEWKAETLEHPLLDHDGSVVAEVDGRLVALTFLVVERNRGVAENEMTGTLPGFRERGLATTVKRAAIAWAAANGIREIWTSNHDENAPMLAVNRKLGYRPVKVTTDYVREAGTASARAPAEPAPSPRPA